LDDWANVKRASTNLANFPGKSRILPEPYGCALVIGAWNYPYQLSLAPVVAAIAAGNTVILKPSELAARTSAIMQKLINSNFEPAFFHVVEGSVPETTALLNLPFDKIFFTGSPAVGKIVMAAAAKHLSSVTLELGGKSPCIVLKDANLKMAAKRIAWGKFLNAGQTCIAPDYLLIEPEVRDKFLNLLVQEIQKNLGAEPHKSEAFVKMINERNFDRVSNLIQADKVFFGGITNRSARYISPTILKDISWDDKVMQEEIFGPVLPVINLTNIDEAISQIRQHPKPLALYMFSNNKALIKKVLQQVSFGGGCINDTIMHIANPNLPFGGVNNSGLGSYHGEDGFRAFSHYKSVLYKTNLFEPFVKYPPYNGFKKWILRMLME
jgi:aldehyde dehydrogenase (NAD+)